MLLLLGGISLGMGIGVSLCAEEAVISSKATQALEKFEASLQKENEKYGKKANDLKEKCLKVLRSELKKQHDPSVITAMQKHIDRIIDAKAVDIFGVEISAAAGPTPISGKKVSVKNPISGLK